MMTRSLSTSVSVVYYEDNQLTFVTVMEFVDGKELFQALTEEKS